MTQRLITDAERTLEEQLKQPFEPKLVKWRTGGGSRSLAYIDARDVMKRLDTVLGTSNYQTHYIRVDGGFVCELSVRVNGEWITKSDGANDTKIEPVKGGISGSLKRAANAWGIGRYLYYLDSKYANLDFDEWPRWALPGNDVQNWEEVAEKESTEAGMDELEVEYIAGVAAEHGGAILGAKTLDELNEAWDSLSEEEQGILAKEYSKKLAELNASN